MRELALLIGGIGQAILFGSLIPERLSLLLVLPFMLPWIIIFFMNFSAASPFTYKMHRRITLVTILAWAAFTIVAEILWLAGLFARLDSTQIAVAQVFMNLGWLSFVPLWLMYKRGDPGVGPNSEE